MQQRIYAGLATMAIVLIICGCAPNTFKAKSGAGNPEGPRALFKPEKNVAISDIDGKTVFVTARNWWIPIITKTRASVMPGEHTLTIQYAQTGWSSLGCKVTIDAQPGKTYMVKGRRLSAEESQGFIAVKKPQVVKVVVWIEEEETGVIAVKETACTPLKS